MTEPTLPDLLARLSALFPPEHPVVFKPPVEDRRALAGRFSGGHADRWFAACDGQEGSLPAVDAHAFTSLDDAVATLEITDRLRADPEGYWVEPSWIAIAADGAGQHIMIDDRDGRVLFVAHDDDHVGTAAESPEAWVRSLLDGHADGTLVFSETFGLVEATILEGIEARRREREAAAAAPLPTKHKIGLVLSVGVALGVMGLLIWWLESGRT